MHDVSIPAALIAGLISFLSPCVLPLVPPYLIYLTGATIEHVASDETNAASKRAVMISAVMFVLGFSTVFVALGASASFIGSLVRAWSAPLSIVAGIVIILMGLHFLGLTRIGLLMREGRLTVPKPVGLWGAYVMGLAFAFGWTPCIGPTMSAVLTLALDSGRASRGGLLMVTAVLLVKATREGLSNLGPRLAETSGIASVTMRWEGTRPLICSITGAISTS